MTADGLPAVKPASSATVKEVPPIVTEARPDGADTPSVPVAMRDSPAGPSGVRPDSNTVAWPMAAPLPSTAVIAGAASSTPVMVSVSTAVSRPPSGSAMR